MKHNVGGADRNIRWVLGGGAIVAALFAPVTRGWRATLLAFGASELLMAGTRYCPVNAALGIDTTHGGLKQPLAKLATAVAGHKD